jgi:hypothetical protein
MELTRRALFGMVAAAVLDPEKLLWKPGKLISIPKPPIAFAYLEGGHRFYEIVWDTTDFDQNGYFRSVGRIGPEIDRLRAEEIERRLRSIPAAPFGAAEITTPTRPAILSVSL